MVKRLQLIPQLIGRLSTLIPVLFFGHVLIFLSFAEVKTKVETGQLAELPLAFPVQSAEIASYFNQIAKAEDIAMFPYHFVHLLPEVTAGRRMVAFFSWAEAEKALPEMADEIDIIGYNPEHWDLTPAAEKENLPETVRKAAEMVHEHGLEFMFVPDRRFAEASLAEVAPYVDAVILQGQRLQDNPKLYSEWIENMSAVVKASNPETKIYIQVAAPRGPAEQMITAILSVETAFDGISVWSLPRSFPNLQTFVSQLSMTTISPTGTVAEPIDLKEQTAVSTTPASTATIIPVTATGRAEEKDPVIENSANTPVPAPLDETETPSGSNLIPIAVIAGVTVGLIGLWYIRKLGH